MIRMLMVATLVAISAQTAIAEEQPSVAVLSSPAGRWVYGQVGPNRADQFLLDTQSGRMWRMVLAKESLMLLEPVPFADQEGKAVSFTPPATK